MESHKLRYYGYHRLASSIMHTLSHEWH